MTFLTRKLLQGQNTPVEVVYVDSFQNSTSALSTYTFATVPIGDAFSGRIVLVGATYVGTTSGVNPDVTVTVDGNNATKLVDINDSTGEIQTGVWGILDESGTTCDVVVSSGANNGLRCFVQVYSLRNVGSLTPVGTDSGEGNIITPVSFTVDTESGGGVFVSGYTVSGGLGADPIGSCASDVTVTTGTFTASLLVDEPPIWDDITMDDYVASTDSPGATRVLAAAVSLR